MNGKRILKYCGLALCVGLCFLLTACYIAPDDINNSNDDLSTGSLIFQTLAPTATVAVTPETVVIETQNVFGSTIAPAVNTAEAATPTPTPAGNGWNAWGTVTTTDSTPLNATPEPSTIVFITPTPAIPTETQGTSAQGTVQIITKAPATPSPTPPSLQVGFTGSDEVRDLQKRLKALGYYDGSVDGDFGKGTESAVKAFQKANGLTADGKAGKQTLDKLKSGKAITKKQATATATPKKDSTGSKKTAAPTKKVTATPKPTATPNLEKDYYLQTGSSGAKVRTLQKRLIELGWLDGKANGEYDAATRAAVIAFQKKTKGLYDDGVAGPDTLKALYSNSAARSSTPASSIGETLEFGMENDAVKSLQKRLKELGYLSGTADGKFGTATEAAVIAFQQRNGLTADGKAGNATLNRLYSSDAVKSGGGAVTNRSDDDNKSGADTSGISSTGYVTQENGSSGEQVKKIQKRLKELGYYASSVDGKYGDSTEAAVMAFQLRNNLTVDGKAGPATQRALFGSGTSISYSALRKGEEGTAVKNLQYTLYELGYYDGAIDGIYGDTTSDAVRAFQIQNRLSPVDGVAGSATLAKLYSADAIPETAANMVDYDTVRPGDKGETVVEIQDCLVQMGYLDEITGVYDDATVDAVKRFQKENGISADGVAGDKTLVLLFGF